MELLSFMVLLNPFFGCLIAWILLYQSDRTDAFIVLGFEGGALILHYVAVWLEGCIDGFVTFLIHGLLPLVPFGTAIGLVFLYLKEGGVCYIVEESLFRFTGCEVCVDGYPPVNGTCFLQNGTSYEFVRSTILDIGAISSITDVDEGVDIITSRADQVSYCANQNPDGPQVDFCFFDFQDGKLDGLVIERTPAPTAVPVFSTNLCGATVAPGDRLAQCTDLLWNPTDASMHCFASGGPGDPCHLSLTNDGSNQGRFKDPSLCKQEELQGGFRSYGDALYLWVEPDSAEREFTWAGNAWLAYSTDRFQTEMAARRQDGMRVVSPQVRFTNGNTVRQAFQDFFGACGSACDDPESPGYIDILAVNVYCDLAIQSCAQTASSVAETMKSISAEFGDRPVYITRWGMEKSFEANKLADAMYNTGFFFPEGSTIERVLWWSGNEESEEENNLAYMLQDGRTLADVWLEECNNLI